jgi:hypothetical protein
MLCFYDHTAFFHPTEPFERRAPHAPQVHLIVSSTIWIPLFYKSQKPGNQALAWNVFLGEMPPVGIYP